jgi:16S rRNA (guanine(966)-N(2))-methyltransferase RsmD
LRIISGTHKGRRLNPPKNLPVRPTTDLAKESLFNVLNNLVDFTELDVLDLFAGTGSITFEFASRECRSVIAMDNNYKCVEYIRNTVQDFRFDNVKTIKADVFKSLKSTRYSFDLIFADPPYEHTEISQIPELIFKNGWLKKNAWLIVEHPKGIDFARHECFVQKRVYGRVNFSFFKNDQYSSS